MDHRRDAGLPSPRLTFALKQEKSVKEAVAEMIAQTSVQLAST